jgi:HPt (histidine-containing phosphotransfer) domain-containing protein
MNFNDSNLHQTYIELLLEKTLNNRALAKTLFEKLFTSLPIQIEELDRLLNNKEVSRAQKLIHDIHGAIASCGLVNIEYQAGLLEKNLSEDNLEKAQKNFQNLNQLVRKFVDCQEAILAGLQAK